MRAVRLHSPGGPEGLSLDDVESPRLRPGDALVRVHAAAITRGELEWPLDRLPAVPSYELSGVVETVGPGAERVAAGDAVYSLAPFDRDGAAAELAAVPADVLAPKPRTLDHVESAALPLAGLSAWQGLFDHGRLEAGQRVVIHGAAGGVGHLAVQLARQRGAYVIGTTSRAPERVRELGADEVVDLTQARPEDVLAPVDLVFDTAGGDVLARSSLLARDGGRVVSVAEEAPGATYFVVEPRRDQLVELAALADSGDLRPSIDSVHPLADARAAFARSLTRGTTGKVVLRVADA